MSNDCTFSVGKNAFVISPKYHHTDFHVREKRNISFGYHRLLERVLSDFYLEARVIKDVALLLSIRRLYGAIHRLRILLSCGC